MHRKFGNHTTRQLRGEKKGIERHNYNRAPGQLRLRKIGWVVEEVRQLEIPQLLHLTTFFFFPCISISLFSKTRKQGNKKPTCPEFLHSNLFSQSFSILFLTESVCILSQYPIHSQAFQLNLELNLTNANLKRFAKPKNRLKCTKIILSPHEKWHQH